jgi:hypothetical protein
MAQMEGGDRIQLLTPGGGGYGPPPDQPTDGSSGDGAALPHKRRQAGSQEFTVQVRDSGSVQQYIRNQETV